MATTVRLNSREVQAYLDGAHGVRELLSSAAEKVLAAAKADPHDDTGEYEASLAVIEDHTDRLVLRVGSTLTGAGASKANAIEARFGVLARALDAAG